MGNMSEKILETEKGHSLVMRWSNLTATTFT